LVSDTCPCLSHPSSWGGGAGGGVPLTHTPTPFLQRQLRAFHRRGGAGAEGGVEFPEELAPRRLEAVEGAAEDQVLDHVAGHGGPAAEVLQRGERPRRPRRADRVEIGARDAFDLLEADADGLSGGLHVGRGATRTGRAGSPFPPWYRRRIGSRMDHPA